MNIFSALVAAAAVLATVVRAEAQDVKAPVVGVILQGGPWYSMVNGLKIGLRELHLEDGRQLRLDVRDARGDLKAVEDAARSFERDKAGLIVTIATSVTLAAQKATTGIPIVFCAGTNPVAVGLVESVPRPGGRITGVEFSSTDLTGKRLELLREMVPKLDRVITFYNPGNRSAIESSKEAREAAARLGIAMLERHVSSPDELKAALDAFKPGEAGAYLAVSDAMVDSKAQLIIDAARAKKLPTIFYTEDLTTRGGLSSYSADFGEVGRLAAKYVQRILSGAKPGDLPVEQVNRLSFAVNLKTAKEIELVIAETVLTRADRIIE